MSKCEIAKKMYMEMKKKECESEKALLKEVGELLWSDIQHAINNGKDNAEFKIQKNRLDIAKKWLLENKFSYREIPSHRTSLHVKLIVFGWIEDENQEEEPLHIDFLKDFDKVFTYLNWKSV